MCKWPGTSFDNFEVPRVNESGHGVPVLIEITFRDSGMAMPFHGIKLGGCAACR